MVFFILFYIFQYRYWAWAAPSLFCRFAPPTCDAQLCLLWFLARVIIRATAEFGGALGRRFLGRAVGLEKIKGPILRKILDFFFPPFFALAFQNETRRRAAQISRLGGKESVKNVAFAWNTCTENPHFYASSDKHQRAWLSRNKWRCLHCRAHSSCRLPRVP